jgi:hypothetical protein
MSLPAILTASAALENANKAALGITYAFDTPPETLTGSKLPISLRFCEAVQTMGGSRLLGRYNIYHWKIEVHWPRGVIHEAIAQCFGTIRAYQDLYTAHLSISGTCNVSGFREPACEGPFWLKYGSSNVVETIGFVFHLWSKEILDDITVAL